MRIALLSDIHGNLPALRSVTSQLKEDRVDKVWVLGDLIGYGPNPLKVLEWFKSLDVSDSEWVMGNHEYCLMKRFRGDFRTSPLDSYGMPSYHDGTNDMMHYYAIFNNRVFEGMPEVHDYAKILFRKENNSIKQNCVGKTKYVLSHCKPTAYQIADAYNYYPYPWTTEVGLTSFLQEVGEYKETEKPLIFLHGHTHIPTLIYGTRNGNVNIKPEPSVKIQYGTTYSLGGEFTIINPGSVGQPRDLDKRASYAVIDTQGNSVTYHRIEYNIQETIAELYQSAPKLIEIFGAQETWDKIINPLCKRLQEAPLPNGSRVSVPFEWQDYFTRSATHNG